MDIPRFATMAEVFENHRRRGYHVETLKAMEDAIYKARLERKDRDDCSYWKYADNIYKQQIVT